MVGSVVYEMKLMGEPFEQIISGKKTIELRLFDDKRKRLNIGDKIIFTNLENPTQRIAVIVKSLHRYATFEELFMDIPLERCGDDSSDSPKTAAAKMNQYYSAEQIQRYGVLGIGIVMTDMETVLKQLEEQKRAEFERLFPDGMK